MIKEIIFTILPTLLILALILAVVKPLYNIELKWVLISLSIGILLPLPALFTMRFIGFVFIMSLTTSVPTIIYKIISAFNEEAYKYIGIYKFIPSKNRTIYALFIGGGFALCETLYLSLGNSNLAVLRSVITLPLHLVTAVLLSKGVINKRYFLLATLVHISFNIIIR